MTIRHLGAVVTLSAALVLTGAGSGSAVETNNVFTLSVPGGVPAFSVGPITDNDPNTPDVPPIEATGVQNVSLSVGVGAGAEPSVEVLAGGAATPCGGVNNDARVDQVVRLTANESTAVAVSVSYEEVTTAGDPTPVSENAGDTVGDERTINIPVCIR